MPERQQPQQSTLSFRIPPSIRDYLERVRVALSDGQEEQFTLSDATKVVLEEARQFPLDERLRVSSLLLDPTATLLVIRSKWERQAVLSPGEWVVLAHYVEIVCEGKTEDAALPKRESFIELLKSFRVLLNLRVTQPSSRDPYYLSKLLPSPIEKDGVDARARTIGALVDNVIENLSKPGCHIPPIYIGRILAVALQYEDYPSALALHEALLPFLPTVFRLAARGHWLEERRPVRPLNPLSWNREDPSKYPFIPPVVAPGGDFQLSTLVTRDGDLAISLSMKSRDVLLALESYPQIREFVALLERLPETGYWKGVEFIGYAHRRDQGTETPRLYFRHHGATFGFSLNEWNVLKEAFQNALGSPVITPILAELDLEYGNV